MIYVKSIKIKTKKKKFNLFDTIISSKCKFKDGDVLVLSSKFVSMSELITLFSYNEMGMTITEKILARASNKNMVSPDDVVIANIDKVMVHDVSGPGVIKVFSEWEKQ